MSLISPLRRWWLNGLPHRFHLARQVPSFLRACPEPFRGQVLEVGAGSGLTSRQILETFPQVELTAIDIDDAATDMFDSLKEKYGRRLKVERGNVLRLHFDRNSFDFVIVINVMSSLQLYGVKAALRELLRVTRPGGLIGVSEHLLMTRPGVSSREVVQQVLMREDCDVLYVKGRRRYDMWIRKPYPVEPT